MSLNGDSDRARAETEYIFRKMTKSMQPQVARQMALYAKRYLDGEKTISYKKLKINLHDILFRHYRRVASIYVVRTIDAAKGAKKGIREDMIQYMLVWAGKEALKKSVSIAQNYRQGVKKIEGRVKDEIEQGILEGEGEESIKKRIYNAARRIGIVRAQVISRTEVGQAAAQAERETIDALGLDIKRKEWVNSGLDNSRESHVEADGQSRPNDKPFDVGTGQLMYARDPSGPAREVINCQCDTLYFEE